MAFKESKASIDDALVTFDIFTDVKKGEHASEHILEDVFGTLDKRKIAEEIIKKGVVQVTAEYKNKLREELRKQIVNLIASRGVDPRSGLPHPPQRVESAMEEAKVGINETKTAEEQVNNIVIKLRPILPIRFEVREIAIKIPAQYTGKAYGVLKGFGKILKEDWLNDGTLAVVIEIPAGAQDDLFDQLNGLTHGDIETEILNRR